MFSGIEARLVPPKEEGFDDAEMLHRIDGRTKIIFVCNPNNPTGAYWPRDRLTAFPGAVNSRRIVVLDEAYFEFVEAKDYPDGASFMKTYPNVFVFRTFSKMYGIAGLRIGYLIGDFSVVDMILCEELGRMGLTVIAGGGNFPIVRMPGNDTLAYWLLMREGVRCDDPSHDRLSFPQSHPCNAGANGDDGSLRRRPEKSAGLKGPFPTRHV